MDVYLTREALMYLEGEALDTRAVSRGGLLLGHKRGQRFYVEKVFPCRLSFFLSLAHFLTLDRLFQGKIIGFYSLMSQAGKKSLFLQPFAFGKVYLEVKPGRKKLSFKPSVIDFRNHFYFKPITAFVETKEKS